MARVEAARAGESGVQILTMGQLAARSAGGLLRPIDPDDLKIAVREALASVQLGELEPIKDLPGMVRAAAGTLDKVWSAGIDLSREKHPRLAALHKLEQEVLRRLPACMKRPQDLVALACARIGFAKAVIGPVEIHGHSEMSPCWRPLLHALSGVVPVTWIAGSRHVPKWLGPGGVGKGAHELPFPRGQIVRAPCPRGSSTSDDPRSEPGTGLPTLRSAEIEIRTEPPSNAEPILYSCAHPHHEVIEAFRWMRGLLAAGTARPEEIAIAAASPADFDDHVLALSRDCNIPVHFVHGTKAVGGREGQLAAALAEVLVKGLSQERVRRLFGMLPRHAPALRDLPPAWTRILPADAPLTSLDRWEQVFARTAADDWPEGIDHSASVLDILRLLAQGPAVASEAGETLLSGVARALWRRALQDGPAEALPVTLTRLRSDDGLEPATHVIFASAMALASAPRAYVRLLALNTGRWPRGISEDRLIPDHVMQIDELDPLPIADADRRDFATIVAAAKSVTASFSRRDVEGRLLGRSPLVTSSARKCSSGATIPPPSGEVGDPDLIGEPVGAKGNSSRSRHPPPDRHSLRSGGRPPPKGEVSGARCSHRAQFRRTRCILAVRASPSTPGANPIACSRARPSSRACPPGFGAGLLARLAASRDHCPRRVRGHSTSAPAQGLRECDVAEENAVALVTVHAAKGLEWPVVIPINMTGRPHAETGVMQDRRLNVFSTRVLDVEPTGYAALKEHNEREDGRERVRLWYVATTRARDLLILPRHGAELFPNSWANIVDLQLDSSLALFKAKLGDEKIPAPDRVENTPDAGDIRGGSGADHAGDAQGGVDKAEPDGTGRWAAVRARAAVRQRRRCCSSRASCRRRP